MRASRPEIVFHVGRGAAHRPRLGLPTAATTYHVGGGPRRQTAVGVLRSPTSRFRFPVVGRLGQVAARRAVLQLGLPRARRG